MKNKTSNLIILSLLMCVVLSVVKTTVPVLAETEWSKEKYSLTANNGDTVKIDVMVFKDETGLYWKQTENGLELYRYTEEEDNKVIWSSHFIKMGNTIYCVEDEVLKSGFVPLYYDNQAINNCWLYFNDEGKLQGNIRAHGLFDVEESGLYFFIIVNCIMT